jgi:hypothetical protein
MLRAWKVIVATVALNNDETISSFTGVTAPVPRALSAQFIRGCGAAHVAFQDR